MASRNQLLGSGKIEVEEETGKITIAQSSDPTGLPAWRFHKDCREGVLVKTALELAKLEAAGGWVDHPGKIFLLPGHEHLYEGSAEEEGDPPAGDE
jgi:hypothetical protein